MEKCEFLYKFSKSIDNYPDVKQKYELCVQTFIDGSWKTAKNMSKVNKILEVLSNMED